MSSIIEISIETENGIADCRIEQHDDDPSVYNATILYPHIVNGFSRSEVYSYDMWRNDSTGGYSFAPHEEVHPGIKAIEGSLSQAIVNSTN